jgi:ubiquitin-conjugating enzyme E2 W
MASISARRLGKELTEIKAEGCPVGAPHFAFLQVPCTHTSVPGIKLVKADDFQTWHFTIETMGESIYAVRS